MSLSLKFLLRKFHSAPFPAWHHLGEQDGGWPAWWRPRCCREELWGDAWRLPHCESLAILIPRPDMMIDELILVGACVCVTRACHRRALTVDCELDMTTLLVMRLLFKFNQPFVNAMLVRANKRNASHFTTSYWSKRDQPRQEHINSTAINGVTTTYLEAIHWLHWFDLEPTLHRMFQ